MHHTTLYTIIHNFSFYYDMMIERDRSNIRSMFEQLVPSWQHCLGMGCHLTGRGTSLEIGFRCSQSYPIPKSPSVPLPLSIPIQHSPSPIPFPSSHSTIIIVEDSISQLPDPKPWLLLAAMTSSHDEVLFLSISTPT